MSTITINPLDSADLLCTHFVFHEASHNCSPLGMSHTGNYALLSLHVNQLNHCIVVLEMNKSPLKSPSGHVLKWENTLLWLIFILTWFSHIPSKKNNSKMGLEAHLLFSLIGKFWLYEYSWYANITGPAPRPPRCLCQVGRWQRAVRVKMASRHIVRFSHSCLSLSQTQVQMSSLLCTEISDHVTPCSHCY